MSLEMEILSVLRHVLDEIGALREELGTRPESLERDLLTYDQAAELVSVSTSTIKRWVRSGALPASGKGKLRRVRPDDVRACFAANGKPSATSPDTKASVTSILATVRR